MKRAAKISNYFPIIHGSTITTPFELAHGTKTDFRILFPMFSLAHVRQPTNHLSNNHHASKTTTNTTGHQVKFTNQTIKCITLGRDPLLDDYRIVHWLVKDELTNAAEFYNAPQLLYDTTNNQRRLIISPYLLLLASPIF